MANEKLLALGVGREDVEVDFASLGHEWFRMQVQDVVAIPIGATVSVDIRNGTGDIVTSGYRKLTLTGDVTDINFVNAVEGDRWWVEYVQDGNGPWTLTHNAAIEVVAPAVSGTGHTEIEYYHDGTSVVALSARSWRV